jgi:hypothetical protein
VAPARESVAPVPEPAPPSDSTADASVAASERPVVAPTAAATQGPEVREPDASLVALERSLDTLDFASLVKRLRKTKAINLPTKIAVKSQSDDLLDAFRAYHRQRGTATLAELRRVYDSLFHELHSLLREADPPLDRDIAESRAAIWEILADPRKFSASVLAPASS